MQSFLILLAVTGSTFIGDYCIKIATSRDLGLLSPLFLAGAILYGAPAIGWYFLMRAHSLAAIGVLYSASTILLLTAMGVFIFREAFGLREALGVALALASVLVMTHKG